MREAETSFTISRIQSRIGREDTSTAGSRGVAVGGAAGSWVGSAGGSECPPWWEGAGEEREEVDGAREEAPDFPCPSTKTCNSVSFQAGSRCFRLADLRTAAQDRLRLTNCCARGLTEPTERRKVTFSSHTPQVTGSNTNSGETQGR